MSFGGSGSPHKNEFLNLSVAEVAAEMLVRIHSLSTGLSGHLQSAHGHLPPFSSRDGRRVSREVFPLPFPKRCKSVLVSLKQVAGSWDETVRAQFIARHAAEDLWVTLSIASLNALEADHHAPRYAAAAQPSVAQQGVISLVARRCHEFCSRRTAKGTEPRTPSEPMADRTKGKSLDYQSGAIVSSHPLTLRQVLPALPPTGTAARHELTEFAGDDLLYFLDDVSRCLLPENEVVLPLPKPKVMCDDLKEWEAIIRALFNLGIVRPIAYEEVPCFQGEPILCGAFGVGKPGKVTELGELVLRFIMDVRTTNSIFTVLHGDLGALAGAPSLLRAVLLPEEIAFVSTEDLVASFYLLHLPQGWHPYFCFRLPVDSAVFGLPPGKKMYAAVTVLPMGFSGATGMMQSWHRRLALGRINRGVFSGAALAPDREIRGDRPFPMSAAEGERSCWGIYIDDFVDLRIAPSVRARALEGMQGDHQGRLRITYGSRSIPRNVDKGHSSIIEVERLGYELDGVSGWYGISVMRALEICGITLYVEARVTVPLLILQILTGKIAHAIQLRRPLFSWLHGVWKHFRSPEQVWRPRAVGAQAKSELLGLCCLMPLCGADLKAEMDRVVTSSDASMTGLGVSRTVGLSPQGIEFCRHLISCSSLGASPMVSLPSPKIQPRIMAVGLFDGIGGLRRSLERLEAHVVYNVSVEWAPRAQRVVREAWPGTREFGDIRLLTREAVAQLLDTAVELRILVCIIAGGFPCQDVSLLNKFRAGAGGDRSGLFVEWIRVCQLFLSGCLSRGLIYLGVGECTIMTQADARSIDQQCQWPRIELCSSGASRVRRPRNYWTSRALTPKPGFDISPRAGASRGRLWGPLEPTEMWTMPGWAWPHESNEARLPTFTRAIPRARPPPGAPGLLSVEDHELRRYERDQRRFPPYTYQDCFCLWPEAVASAIQFHPADGRVASATEREILMGFLPGHTRRSQKGHAEGVRGFDTGLEDTDRCALIGNSFHTMSMSIIVGSMLSDVGFPQLYASPQVLMERFLQELLEYERTGQGRIIDELIDLEELMAPRGPVQSEVEENELDVTPAEIWGEMPRLFTAPAAEDWHGPLHRRAASMWLAEAHFRACDARGSEVRTDLNVPLVGRPVHRTSVDSRRWRWRHVLSQKVKRAQQRLLHINRLELEAADLTLKWRLRSGARGKRFLHLLDSRVAISVVARGRTSSFRLRGVTRRLGARQLAGGMYVAWGYVRSGLNVSDAPSRQP